MNDFLTDETLVELKADFEPSTATNKNHEQGIDDELENGIKPWPQAVDGVAIANTIKQFIDEHIVMSEESKIATTLWLIGTYIFNEFRIFPKLLITSPEKRCGKTTLMEILNAFCHRGLSSSNTSAAAIFRAVDLWQPTLLIDEVDTFLKQNEELRGIINSGHNKSGAYIMRVEGDAKNRTPKRFSTWSPMVIAMIKTPQDTIFDRSIVAQLKRKTFFEKTKKLPANIFAKFKELRRKIRRWGDDHNALIQNLTIEAPNYGNDRAQDNWQPLFVVAKLLNSEWLDKVSMAYKKLTNIPKEESISVLLLQDIKSTFVDLDKMKIHSKDLIDRLNVLEEQPWCEFQHGRPFSAKTLARLLKPFHIKSKQIWIDGSNRNGYEWEDFEDAFNRYLLIPGSQNSKALEPSNSATLEANEHSSSDSHPELQNGLNSSHSTASRVLEGNTHIESAKERT